MRLASFAAAGTCCGLLTQYLILDVTSSAFDANLDLLCAVDSDNTQRCRQEFAYITEVVPFLIRYDRNSSSSSSGPETIEAQCQQRADLVPVPTITCEVPAATTEDVFSFDATEACCSLVGAFITSSRLGGDGTTPTALSLTRKLCSDQACVDTFAAAAAATVVDPWAPPPDAVALMDLPIQR